MTSRHAALLQQYTNLMLHADVVVVAGGSACLWSAVNNLLVNKNICQVQKLLILMSMCDIHVSIHTQGFHFAMGVCVKSRSCDLFTFPRPTSLQHCNK